MSWTKKQIEKQKYDGRSKCWFPDPAKDGSGIRVLPSGKKSFVMKYRFNGKLKYLTYGSYRGTTASICLAEKAKTELLHRIDKGEDPQASQKIKLYTLGEYFPKYLKYLERENRSPSTIGTYKDYYKLCGPILGNSLMVEIKRPDIENLREKILTPKGVQFNGCVRLIKAMFNQAERTGGVPEGHPNPCRGVKFKKEISKIRYLNAEELGRLYDVLNRLPASSQIRDLISLYLVNGFRKQELLTLKWKNVELDGDNPHVYLPKTKNGKDHQIPLVPDAIKILKEIPRSIDGNPYVFPSPLKKYAGRPLSDIKVAWYKIRKEAGLEDVTIHDLRRTCGSMMVQNGVPLELIQQILNHSNPEMTRVYARLAPKQIREALNITGEIVGNLLNQDKIRLVS